MRAAAHFLADCSAAAAGPVEFLLPMGGFSSEDRPGGAIEAPGLRSAFADALAARLPGTRIHRLDAHIDDPAVAELAATRMLDLIARRESAP